MKTLIVAAFLSSSLLASATAIVSNPSRSVSTSGVLTLAGLPEPLTPDSDTKTTDGPYFGIASTGGFFEDLPSGNRASVAIAASQLSTINGDGVTFRGGTGANVSLNGSAITANATSFLDVDFTLLQPHIFDLEVSLTSANPDGGLIPFQTIQFGSVANYFLFELGNFSFSDSVSGVLDPGVYHLSIQMVHDSGLDGRDVSPPSADWSQLLVVDLGLHAISAPDYGSTAFLLALPIGLGLMLQKRSASSRVTSSR